MKISFLTQIKKVTIKSLVSLDKSCQVLLEIGPQDNFEEILKELTSFKADEIVSGGLVSRNGE